MRKTSVDPFDIIAKANSKNKEGLFLANTSKSLVQVQVTVYSLARINYRRLLSSLLWIH